MIPMGRTLEATRGASVATEVLVSTLGTLSPVALMAGVFLLTTGTTTNIMVFSPGGYRFMDYVSWIT